LVLLILFLLLPLKAGYGLGGVVRTEAKIVRSNAGVHVRGDAQAGDQALDVGLGDVTHLAFDDRGNQLLHNGGADNEATNVVVLLNGFKLRLLRGILWRERLQPGGSILDSPVTGRTQTTPCGGQVLWTS
jgi:hypothetical protein